MSSISFSIVGFGRIGQRHAKIIHKHTQYILRSVYDMEPKHFDRCEVLDFPDVNTFHNLEVFLAAKQSNDQRSEVVTIATPNRFHASYAVKFLSAGYHLVIRKPMGINSTEWGNYRYIARLVLSE